jgi:hypothetical protein
MELDDLKAKWQKDAIEHSQLNKKDPEQLQVILRKKTSGLLVNIKKKYETIISILLVGMFANILISPFLHWILGEEGPVFRMPSLLPLLTIIIMCMIILMFYWIKYISFKTNIVENDLKNSLRENIQSLKRSFKQEACFLIALFIGLFIAGRSTSQAEGNGDFWDIFRADILISLFTGCLTIAFALFMRSKYYKKNIKELQEYLSEFDEV